MKLSRILEGSGADDAGLASHQARDRVDRANSARVGQRNGVAGVIVGHKLSFSGARDNVFIRQQEVREAHVLGPLDARNNETASSIRFGHIDGNTQVDVCWLNHDGFPVDLVVVDVLARELLEGLDHRPGDQVGE